MGSEVDTELLIEKVKQYPEVWDTSSQFYKDKVKKREAWLKICTEICAGFNEIGATAQQEIAKTYMSKWRNLKDNFKRNIRKKVQSGHESNYGRSYIFADQLSFLLRHSSTARREATSVEQESEDSVEGKSAVLEHTNVKSTASTSRKHPPKRPWNFDHSIDISLAPVTEINDDRSFFESLIPIINTFTVDQKLDFRSGILELVKNIRLHNRSPTTKRQSSGIQHNTAESLQQNLVTENKPWVHSQYPLSPQCFIPSNSNTENVSTSNTL